jgi:DNA-binding NarL/FixJ family response regulator
VSTSLDVAEPPRWHAPVPPAPSGSVGVVRVAIVEDDPLLRDGLAQLVDAADGFSVCWSAGSLGEGLAALADAPDVVLVDLALPDGTGLDIIAAVRARGLATKTVVITVFADVRSVVGAIEEGADGYLLKDADTHQIAAAITTVLQGGAPISPAVASHILARVRGEVRRRPSAAPVALTAKETQVLEGLASGRSFKEVASQQHISLHTVGDHVKSIYRKLSVNSRGEAVFKAVQAGLITMDAG